MVSSFAKERLSLSDWLVIVRPSRRIRYIASNPSGRFSVTLRIS